MASSHWSILLAERFGSSFENSNLATNILLYKHTVCIDPKPHLAQPISIPLQTAAYSFSCAVPLLWPFLVPALCHLRTNGTDEPSVCLTFSLTCGIGRAEVVEDLRAYSDEELLGEGAGQRGQALRHGVRLVREWKVDAGIRGPGW
jgi:hypothetical protein